MEVDVGTFFKSPNFPSHDIYSNTASLNGWLFVRDPEVRLASTSC